MGRTYRLAVEIVKSFLAHMNSIPGTRLVCFAAIQPNFSQSPNRPFRAGRDGPA
jgi:hypothetical protein